MKLDVKYLKKYTKKKRNMSFVLITSVYFHQCKSLYIIDRFVWEKFKSSWKLKQANATVGLSIFIS